MCRQDLSVARVETRGTEGELEQRSAALGLVKAEAAGWQVFFRPIDWGLMAY